MIDYHQYDMVNFIDGVGMNDREHLIGRLVFIGVDGFGSGGLWWIRGFRAFYSGLCSSVLVHIIIVLFAICIN